MGILPSIGQSLRPISQIALNFETGPRRCGPVREAPLWLAWRQTLINGFLEPVAVGKGFGAVEDALDRLGPGHEVRRIGDDSIGLPDCLVR